MQNCTRCAGCGCASPCSVRIRVGDRGGRACVAGYSVCISAAHRASRVRPCAHPGTQSSEHCLEQSACLVQWLFHWQGGLVVAPAGQSLTQAHRADSYAPSRPPRPTPTSTPHGTPIGIANTRRLGGIQVQVLQLPATEASRAGMCAANHGRRVCMATRLWAVGGRAPNGGVDVCAEECSDGRAESLRCTRGAVSMPYIYIYVQVLYCTIKVTAK